MSTTILTVLLLGCGGGDADDTGTDSTDGGALDGGASDGGASDGGASDGGASDGGASDGGAGDGGDPWQYGEEVPAIRAEALGQWTLSFDEDAEAAGYSDCSYTRTWEGVQFVDQGYLCPECEVIARGTATVTEGLDCLANISDPVEVRTELWGWSAEGNLYRTSLDPFPLGELAPLESTGEGTAEATWESEYELTEGGLMTLSATATLSWAEDPDTLLPDPFPDRTEPYACGWPINNPGTLTLDYNLHIGQTFPNVRLVNQCGEAMNLWDLYGSWLVMDTSQPDCGPCLSMASTAGDFVEEMAEQGIDVKVVSFLGAGLSAPYLSPEEGVFDSFVASYDHGDPILVDQGFGYSVFGRLAETDIGESFGFPTWVVVSPEMTLVHGNVGFGDWDDVAAVIEEAEDDGGR